MARHSNDADESDVDWGEPKQWESPYISIEQYNVGHGSSFRLTLTGGTSEVDMMWLHTGIVKVCEDLEASLEKHHACKGVHRCLLQTYDSQTEEDCSEDLQFLHGELGRLYGIRGNLAQSLKEAGLM